MRPILLLGLALALAGCGREEETVAEQYERQKAEIENKALAYEAQVENEVSAAEARLEREANLLLESFADTQTNSPAEAPGEPAEDRNASVGR